MRWNVPLEPYRRKRDFTRTPEPSGKQAREVRKGRHFVVQKHAARRLHYDFRLELDGVLKSWAVPKGPSLNPAERRLAVHVEDHPLAYRHFEGIIPPGEYGSGTVLVWDQGTWFPEGDPLADYGRGRLHFRLLGSKLHGSWSLVRTGSRAKDSGDNWLLIKRKDAHSSERDLLEEAPHSVLTGRNLEQITMAAEPVWHGAQGDAAASETPLPRSLGVQLATPVDVVPAGEDWLHEIKHDGYRIVARIEDGKVRLLTRSGKDWTARFPGIHDAVLGLGLDQAWLDGEAVVMLPDGRSSFEALQQALSSGANASVTHLLFDLLHLSGRELHREPLHARKAVLAELLATDRAAPVLRYSDHIVGHGPAFYRQACQVGLEGIVSKHAARPHFSGRSRSWLKIKCLRRQEFVVIGYTEPAGTRTGFGALLLAVHDEAGALVYAGRVGTGFDQRRLDSLHAQLRALETTEPPLPRARLPREALRRVHWVRPELVVEVAFSNWTQGGVLRHSVFQGVREDKPATEVVRESPQPSVSLSAAPSNRAPAVPLSHPDKVLYPEPGLSKRDLAEYYLSVADRMLPEIAGRPLTLLRCPHGQHRDCFYQKHADDSASSAILRVSIPEKGKPAEYMAVDTREGLLALTQMNVLEIHVWGARRTRLTRPDRVVFDLDPDAGLPWEAVPRAAARLHERLLDLGLQSFLRTTGGKGLHVVMPLVRRHDWDQVKSFARAVAVEMVHRYPGEYTATLSKAARRGKLFIDYLRNGQGSTAIASYSTRAHPRATVAVPLAWEELETVRSDAFTVTDLATRLESTDPWAELGTVRQSLTKPILAALGLA